MQNNFPSAKDEEGVPATLPQTVVPAPVSAPALPAAPSSPSAMSAEELAQFEQFKKIKILEQTRARIAKVECDCLSPTASRAQLKTLCRDAERLGLGGIVVLPSSVRPCVAYLGDDPSCSLIAPVSYPHGGDTTESKVAATRRAVKDGVDEVEVYAPFAAVKEGNLVYFKRECKKLKKAARPRALRIVLDCNYLDEREIVRACNCAADCGVNVIRIINAGGLSTITSAKSAVRDKCLIKADGNNLAEMEEAEALGATLINCSAAVEVCSHLLNEVQS